MFSVILFSVRADCRNHTLCLAATTQEREVIGSWIGCVETRQSRALLSRTGFSA
jgi:hypothetical protein